MRLRLTLLAVALACVVGLCAGAASGFKIDRSRTFLGGLFPHRGPGGGVHEDITAVAIRRGMKDAPASLVVLIQAGAENVDVTHHFDSPYHFDSASVAAHRAQFAAGFAVVAKYLRGAQPLADRNPEFFAPSYGSYRAMVASLAASLGQLVVRRDCGGCSRTAVAGAIALFPNVVFLAQNANPDPHRPENPNSVFGPGGRNCGICGVLSPITETYQRIQRLTARSLSIAVRESRGLKSADPLRLKIERLRNAFDAYRAFQALGHAFHATQDFFAHSNYVELMAGVAVEQRIPAGATIPVPQSRGTFNLDGLRAIMGPERFAKLESGSSAAIWLGEGDYCLGSLYNPGVRTTIPIPATIAALLGLPRRISTPGGKNPRPPRGLNYCHYPSANVPGVVRTPGLNKDEPGSAEPSHVNHAPVRRAAEDMTAVLWKSFLAGVHRPSAPGSTATPKPPPPSSPPPAPKPPATGVNGAKPSSGVCKPSSFPIDVLQSLPPYAKTGEYPARFSKLEAPIAYQARCLWVGAASGAEAYVVSIDYVGPAVPGRIASGDCGRNRPDANGFFHSRKRHLTVSGGPRVLFQRATAGDAAILKQVLAAAEAAGVGAACRT